MEEQFVDLLVDDEILLAKMTDKYADSLAVTIRLQGEISEMLQGEISETLQGGISEILEILVEILETLGILMQGAEDALVWGIVLALERLLAEQVVSSRHIVDRSILRRPGN
ncbi:hypothetical protein [Archangium gephyra]|uniref:hypothetical protein n=1 Tax=Archangium gephyra TaxID=48 RepID=UPI00064B3BB5|nr:hypothetical protein [Archangium gephyra]